MREPNKWKALTPFGEEVVGYPVLRLIDESYTSDEPPYFRTNEIHTWDMYVCERSLDCITVSGLNGRTYYKSKCVPIMYETLEELTEKGVKNETTH